MPEQEFIKAWLEMASTKESLDDEIIQLIEKNFNEDEGKLNDTLLYNELLKKSKEKE